MKVDKHLCRVGQMMSIAQFGNMLLSDLLYLVLQVDIKRGMDLHAGARQLALIFEMEQLLEFGQNKISKVRCTVGQARIWLKEIGALRLLESIERIDLLDVSLGHHQT